MKTINKLQYLFIIAIAILFVSCQKEYLTAPESKQAKDAAILFDKVSSTYISNTSSFPLFAGQTIPAGSVDLVVNGSDLSVTYNLSNGFSLLEAHLFVGESLSLMPQTNNGNPKIGNFPYKSGSISGSSFTFTIPLSSLGSELCDKTLYAAAHASVVRQNADGSIQNETAWAGTTKIVQKGSWATYFPFSFACSIDEEEPKSCETAFALGQSTFIDLGLTDSRWGWMYTVSEPGVYETPIYAGAGQNDISKGTLVGTLVIDYDGSNLVVRYNLLSGFTMNETHLFASSSLPTTIAPGQYGNIHDLTDASNDEYSLSISGNQIYIVAHAVVCSSDF
jgi:hypothetical protein